ncbi:pyridoxal phosphate-dependent transferase [Xylariales sp. PMI_506]|nr:pyridoxal phosphate-dependent transferase [Xylariales sp. PMI_506]
MSNIDTSAADKPVAACNGQPRQAIDMSHHLNTLSRSRHPSPLKDIIKFMGYEGMISFAGGLPHPSLFPVHNVSFGVSTPDHSAERLQLNVSNEQDSAVQLAKFLQYGNCTGNDDLRKWCMEFTKRIHKPQYEDVEVLLHPGNTNAWSKVVGLLCEKDDYILCEKFTYPSAQALWIPQGNFAAPIGLDATGLLDTELEETLATWETSHPGVRRPHVLYLVSVGSNPTGVTMTSERRQKIYDVCVKYDIIIVEDDPYFFLQYPEFDLNEHASEYKAAPNDEFVASLVPSFLQFDYQGRVIRLESFSKTLAPGLRLGYFVANAQFTERLLRATETDTQDPSGLSQAMALALLRDAWTLEGYITWLQGLRFEYQRRRDCMVCAMQREFVLVPAAEFPELGGAEGLVVAIETPDKKSRIPIFSFVVPTAGMFLWGRFYLSQNPRFKEIQGDASQKDPEQVFADELWAKLAEELVLLTPGSYYYPWQGAEKSTTKTRGFDPEITFFRLSFAMATDAQMDAGIERFARVIKKSWLGQ